MGRCLDDLSAAPIVVPGHGPIGGEEEVRELQDTCGPASTPAVTSLVWCRPMGQWTARHHDAVHVKRAARLRRGDDAIPARCGVSCTTRGSVGHVLAAIAFSSCSPPARRTTRVRPPPRPRRRQHCHRSAAGGAAGVLRHPRPLPAGKPGDVIKTERVARPRCTGRCSGSCTTRSDPGKDIPVTGLIAVPTTPPPRVAFPWSRGPTARRASPTPARRR